MRQFPAERVLAGLPHPEKEYIQKSVNMKKNHYTPPRLLKTVEVLLEQDFLGTLTKNATIETAGQKVEEYSFSQANEQGFNTSWE